VRLGYQNVYRYPMGFPEWRKKGLPVASLPVPTAGQAPVGSIPGAPGPLHGWAMILTLLGIFAGGIALNLTPCVYPMIPITVSYFGGRSQKGRGHLLAHGLCYLGGLALTNSLMGVTAALTGGLLGSMLRNPAVLVIVSLVLILFATSLFGLWEFQLPGGMTRIATKSHAGYFGVDEGSPIKGFVK